MTYQNCLRQFIHLTDELKKNFLEKVVSPPISFLELKKKTFAELHACQTDRKEQKDTLLRLIADLPTDEHASPQSTSCLLGALLYQSMRIKESYGFLQSLKDSFFASFSGYSASLTRSPQALLDSFDETSIGKPENSRLYRSILNILPEIDEHTKLNALIFFKETMSAILPNGKKRHDLYDFYKEPSFLEHLNGLIKKQEQRSPYVKHFLAIDFLQSLASRFPKDSDEAQSRVYFLVLYGAYLLIMQDCTISFIYFSSRPLSLCTEFKEVLDRNVQALVENVCSLKVQIEAIKIFNRYFTTCFSNLKFNISYFFSPLQLEEKTRRLLAFYEEKERVAMHPSSQPREHDFELVEKKDVHHDFEILGAMKR